MVMLGVAIDLRHVRLSCGCAELIRQVLGVRVDQSGTACVEVRDICAGWMEEGPSKLPVALLLASQAL